MLPLQEEIRRAWKPMGCFAANGTCQSLLDLTSWRTKLPLDEANSKLSPRRSEEHTSELQSRLHLVCRLLLEKKKQREQAVRLLTTRACTRPYPHVCCA